jgi:Flp pilus assembly pilin Flp
MKDKINSGKTLRNLKKDERSQGATEYMLILAAVLIVVASVTATLFSTSGSLGSSVRDQIDNIRDRIIDQLTSISAA